MEVLPECGLFLYSYTNVHVEFCGSSVGVVCVRWLGEGPITLHLFDHHDMASCHAHVEMYRCLSTITSAPVLSDRLNVSFI